MMMLREWVMCLYDIASWAAVDSINATDAEDLDV
jgi:hypothetical protein